AILAQPPDSSNRAFSKMDQTSGSNAIDVPAISVGGLVSARNSRAAPPLSTCLHSFLFLSPYPQQQEHPDDPSSALPPACSADRVPPELLSQQRVFRGIPRRARPER